MRRGSDRATSFEAVAERNMRTLLGREPLIALAMIDTPDAH